jgi:hypothetical protein
VRDEWPANRMRCYDSKSSLGLVGEKSGRECAVLWTMYTTVVRWPMAMLVFWVIQQLLYLEGPKRVREWREKGYKHAASPTPSFVVDIMTESSLDTWRSSGSPVMRKGSI